MYACTHALVFANLIIDGTNHGFHGFMVQLRQADGTTMPGVELGEIGPKLNSAYEISFLETQQTLRGIALLESELFDFHTAKYFSPQVHTH